MCVRALSVATHDALDIALAGAKGLPRRVYVETCLLDGVRTLLFNVSGVM
jgi:hypothetical protein